MLKQKKRLLERMKNKNYKGEKLEEPSQTGSNGNSQLEHARSLTVDDIGHVLVGIGSSTCSSSSVVVSSGSSSGSSK